MGGGWYEIQQFVDNITCKNFNMVMRQFQTTNKLTGKNCKYPWKSDVRGLKTLTALVKVNLCYGNIVWQ